VAAGLFLALSLLYIFHGGMEEWGGKREAVAEVVLPACLRLVL
jgi:hypothetical protein